MGGLSSPALVNSDMSDLMPELAFAGDINGDLWMFKLNKTSPDSSSAYRVFDGHRDANDKPDQPITNTPAIVNTRPNPDTWFISALAVCSAKQMRIMIQTNKPYMASGSSRMD